METSREAIFCMCSRGQRRRVPARTLPVMSLASIYAIIAAVWVAVICLEGIAGHARSLSEWTVLVGFAIVAPVITLWRWNEPRLAMTQIGHEARR